MFHSIMESTFIPCTSYTNPNLKSLFLLSHTVLTLLLIVESQHCLSSSPKMLILPLKTQVIPSGSVPRSPNKLPFHHNVSLTVSLTVGTPPQNVSMVIDTGSELSWLHCNKTLSYPTTFDPTRSTSYQTIPCSSPTCTNRTQDFPIPASCDSNNLCHATLSYADASSSDGNLASDVFHVGSSDISGLVFGCMDSVFSSNSDEDSKSTGLMGMNRGSLSFVSQLGFPKFSYCISGTDFSGLLLLGESNLTWSVPLNYTPLIQISTPLPYFDRVAYTVQLEGIKVLDKLLPIPKSTFEPDHTGAGQTMVDSGTQFTFLLGPAYNALRTAFLNKTSGVLRVLEDPDFVFQGAMDLCYLVPLSQRVLPLLPTVTLVFRGAEMTVSGDRVLYRVPGELRGNDSVHCLSFGNSDLLGVEAYVIGHHHQQNVWMEFDLEKSRIGLAQPAGNNKVAVGLEDPLCKMCGRIESHPARVTSKAVKPGRAMYLPPTANKMIKMQNVTRLCRTKSIVTVNGQIPGTLIIAREGDRLLIKVVNHVQYNVTLHWHGIRQLRSGWADGPAYVTQCPIQTGQTYVYNFTVTGQRGTLFWHAHISWLRATLYGPIVILPKKGVSYPFPQPHKEVPIIFGEWWKADTEKIISQASQTGGAPNISDAYTINGHPGLLYNCSAKDTFKLKVKPGRTYLLRLINAALNDELFFSIANHSLTVVEADAVYVKPFKTHVVLITPGQTTNVLLMAKAKAPNSTFLMASRPYATGPGSFDNTTTAGILEYDRNPSATNSKSKNKKLPLLKPSLPVFNDTTFATKFVTKIRSLANARFPAKVPKKVDRRFFFTIGLGLLPCSQNKTCQGPNNTMLAASVNNVSFVQPNIALLQSHFLNRSRGVYTTDFPTNPPFKFNYTGTPPSNIMTAKGTKVAVLPFNASVELVMQDTSIIGAESHPLHLHGFNFFVVGQGFGNFDPKKDPLKFNLVDPAERNTVGVPSGGWVAIRFLADNPGVWFMHCHLEVHTSWGLKMAWVVNDGKRPSQKLPPPPSDLPKC